MLSTAHSKRRDDGFTLVELLITVGLMGLVAAVISAAIIAVFRSEEGVVRLASESHDTQQGVNYFPLDIQAGPVEVAEYDTTPGAPGCVADGSQNVLQFDKGGSKRVAYRLTVNGDIGRLDRHVCELPLYTGLEILNVADTLDASAGTPASATIIPFGAFVESIELRLVQDNTDALVVASPRGEPRNSPGDCQTDNPIEASHGYGVFIENDVEFVEGDVTGWLGLGGSVSWRNPLVVASGNMSGVAPEYGLYAETVEWNAIYRSDAQAVDGLSVAGSLATATVASHGLSTGDRVVVDLTRSSDIDGGLYTVTVTDPNTFTFPVATPDVTGLFGSVREVDQLDLLDVVGGVATASVLGHGYSVGDLVAIERTGNADLDEDAFVITSVIGPDQFTFAASTPDVAGLSGTARPVTPTVLEVAREKAAIGGPFHQSGDLVYEVTGSDDNFLDLSGPGNPSAEATAGQLDFVTDFSELRDCSAQLAQLIDICGLAGCANEVAVTISGSTVRACSSGPKPQVLNVPEQYFDGNYTFSTTGGGCQGFSQARPLILNVIDTDGDATINFDATPVDWTALGDRKNILFNFPNATVVNVNAGFYGQILAPFAHVTTNGNVEGGVIGRAWTHLSGTIDSNDDLYNNPISWP